MIKKYFPILEALASHKRADFGTDLMAGLTVAVMLVPQGMAYSLLAGMPPIYGLYGGLIPLFLYGILGTSRQMSLGPVAVSALLVFAGISRLAEPGSPEYISLVILTGFLIGSLKVFSSVLKLGFFVNFLSYPVITGFTSAAAIIIAISQLKYLLGFEIPNSSNLTDSVGYAVTHLGETHLPTLFLCIGGMVLILALKRINKSIPGPLIAAILSILLVKLLHLDAQGIVIVKHVPQGLPSFLLPNWTIENIRAVLPTTLTVTLISIVESIAIAKVLESKHDYYKIDANQELLALGIAKIGGAFFQALPTSGSFTRSAVNNETGAKSGFSSIVTSLFILLVLLFLTPLFYYLPTAILASIVLLSVISLFDYHEASEVWKTHRNDFYMMLLTFCITLVLGIEEGVLAGVVLSVLMFMYRNATPHIAVLGKIPNTNYYRNINRFPEAIQLEGCAIIRFDSQLFFANASYFKGFIEDFIASQTAPLEVLILDASSINDIDSSGLKTLREVHLYLKKKKVDFFVTSTIGPVRDLLDLSGFMKEIGKENQFMYVQDAVASYVKRKNSEKESWTPYAVQINTRK